MWKKFSAQIILQEGLNLFEMRWSKACNYSFYAGQEASCMSCFMMIKRNKCIQANSSYNDFLLLNKRLLAVFSALLLYVWPPTPIKIREYSIMTCMWCWLKIVIKHWVLLLTNKDIIIFAMHTHEEWISNIELG